mgnify:CR=1 FL=1
MPPTIDIFDSQTMLEMINESEAFKPKQFLSMNFFPVSMNIEGDTVIIDIFKGKRRVAPFVSPKVEGKLIEKRGYTTRTIKVPYLKPKMLTTAVDLLKRFPGQIPFGMGRSGQEYASEQLGRDLEELMDMIRRRYEVMSSQALVDGKIIVKGDGIDQEIDFLRDPSHEIALVGTDAWDDAASDPIGDILEWKILVQEDSGLTPDVLILGDEALSALLNNEKAQKLLFSFREHGIATLNRIEMAEGSTFYGQIHGINIVSYHDWYLDDLSVSTPYIPSKKAIMAVSGVRSDNATHFAAIQDLKAGLVATPMFPKSWEIEDPSGQMVMVQSAPLVALHRPETTVVVDVLP